MRVYSSTQDMGCKSLARIISSPSTLRLRVLETLDLEMVRVDVVHRIMERQTNTNILFLDACRDNPLARNLARSMGTRSADVGRGLAIVESGIGTLISFSTQPGNVALDGTGRNSPFAGALVKQLSSANDDLSAILISVRNDVMKETQRKQVPWEHSALTGRFYFSGRPSAETSAPSSQAISASPKVAAFDLATELGRSRAGGLYDDRAARKVAAIVQELKFVVPDFDISMPGQDISDAHRRFVGIWTSKLGFGRGAGRHWMLIVTNVEKDGSVRGFTSYGPSTKVSFDAIPAGFADVKGKIDGNKLIFRQGGTPARTFTVTYSAPDRLDVSLKLDDGRSDTHTVHPIWTLVQAERVSRQ